MRDIFPLSLLRDLELNIASYWSDYFPLNIWNFSTLWHIFFMEFEWTQTRRSHLLNKLLTLNMWNFPNVLHISLFFIEWTRTKHCQLLIWLFSLEYVKFFKFVAYFLYLIGLVANEILIFLDLVIFPWSLEISKIREFYYWFLLSESKPYIVNY
jgi:hypothetical protein